MAWSVELFVYIAYESFFGVYRSLLSQPIGFFCIREKLSRMPSVACAVFNSIRAVFNSIRAVFNSIRAVFYSVWVSVVWL